MLSNYKIFYWICLSIIINCASGVVKKSSRLENLNNCGGDFSGYQYTIRSPNYPDNYSGDQDCLYVLHGSPWAKCNQVFHLQFLNFTLRLSHQCKLDYLEIGDRSIFCGNIVGIRTYPGNNNNSLTVRFHSDKGSSDKGFKIRVTTLPCPDSRGSNGITKEEYNNTSNNNESHHQAESYTEPPQPVRHSEAGGIKYDNLYPVYRPKKVFPFEEDIQPLQSEQKPLKVQSNLPPDQPKNSNSTSESLQLPMNNYKSFHSKPSSTKISAYLFASPPDSDHAATSTSARQLESVDVNLNRNTAGLVSQPPTQFLLPTREPTPFNKSSSHLESQGLAISGSRNSQKLIIPARSYGIPAGIPYAPLPGFESQIKTGEVLDNAGEEIDCTGKINIPPTVHGTTVFREGPQLVNYLPSVFEGPITYPATTYGAPGSQYPPTVQSIPNFVGNPVVKITPGTTYFPAPPNQGPNGFLPTPNVLNIFPGYNLNAIPKVRQCCSNIYSSQRFLLASPGFPSRLYSGNSYECVYTIVPASSNVCRLRFNFKYFNYGNDDQYCVYGYVEIDGRRYCGCKTGLTVLSSVGNFSPKIVGVRYMGHPRTKLNGFLIEVVQESCSYNSYPYLSRRKKEIGNATIIDDRSISNDRNQRTKRELGYSYPKPSIVFKEGGGPFFNPGGIGHVGFTSSTKCHALSLLDWTFAAKETYFRGARCIPNGGNGGLIPSVPNYPPGSNIPGYPPSNGGPGNVFPGYPPSDGGNVNPGFPPGGSGPDNNIPTYPPTGGGPGNAIPDYPPSNYPPNYPGPDAGIPPWGNCEAVTLTDGIVSSPQYPNVYPNNVNKCYRFIRSPAGCRLQLSILDFDLESSPGCTKDYVLFSNQNTRYCGRSLTGTKTIFEFPTNNVIDLRFVADSYGSGRGFDIGFMQVPCQVIANR